MGEVMVGGIAAYGRDLADIEIPAPHHVHAADHDPAHARRVFRSELHPDPQRLGGLLKDVALAHHHGFDARMGRGLGKAFHDHFRSYAGGVAHGDEDFLHTPKIPW